MKRLMAALLFALFSCTVFALPSIEQVQAEVASGNYPRAEDMMREVIAAKPGSARAHYVLAEILAHQKRFDQASQEAARARELDPAIKFTKPETFNEFTRLLERERSATKASAGAAERTVQPAAAAAMREPAPSTASSLMGSIPAWAWALGGVAIAMFAWKRFTARSQAPMPATMPGPMRAPMPAPMPAHAGVPAGPSATHFGSSPLGASQFGASPGVGAAQGAPAAASPGSGMLGTGMAVAGGLAAGMLVSKLMNDHQNPGAQGAAAGSRSDGLIPGAFDDGSAANELAQRPIDFGSGDGWGGDAGGDAGGSSDGGDDW